MTEEKRKPEPEKVPFDPTGRPGPTPSQPTPCVPEPIEKESDERGA